MSNKKYIRLAAEDVYNANFEELDGFDILEDSEEAEAENKKSTIKEIKNTSAQEVLTYPTSQEVKKSRIITDKSGNSRRPVNMTLCDDVSEALNILAIKRRVRPWHILNEALRRYLREEGVDGF